MIPSLTNILLENPDKITFQGERYGIHSEEAFCTLTALKNSTTNKPAVIVSLKSNNGGWHHISNDKEVMSSLNAYDYRSIPWHSDILSFLKHHGLIDTPPTRDHTILAGRCWEVNTGPRQFVIIASFWQGHSAVKSKLNYVKAMFMLMKKDINKALFEFSNQDGKFLTYDEAFSSSNPAPSTPKNVEKALMKIQHLSPEAKKSLLGFSSNKLQKMADELGIPVVQLRQQLGMDVAETQDVDRNANPERTYQRFNLSLDTKPPIDLRSIPAWNENTKGVNKND